MKLEQVIEKLIGEDLKVLFKNTTDRDKFARLLVKGGIHQGYLEHTCNYPDSLYLLISDGEVHVSQWDDSNHVKYEDIRINNFIDDAINLYMEQNGIVGTRPFTVLVCPDEFHHNGYPSLWLRFKDGVLESEYTTGWRKEKASFLVEILSCDSEFAFLKWSDDEFSLTKPKKELAVGDRVRILPRKSEWRDMGPGYPDSMLRYVNRVDRVKVVEHSSGGVRIRLKGIPYTWVEEWLEVI